MLGQVARYLHKTKDISIMYDGTLRMALVAYSDADWAGNHDDRRSVSGLKLMMCGAPVVKRSTFHQTIALSQTGAEYMALSDCVKKVVWMRVLLEYLGVKQVRATVIFEEYNRQP